MLNLNLKTHKGLLYSSLTTIHILHALFPSDMNESHLIEVSHSCQCHLIVCCLDTCCHMRKWDGECVAPPPQRVETSVSSCFYMTTPTEDETGSHSRRDRDRDRVDRRSVRCDLCSVSQKACPCWHASSRCVRLLTHTSGAGWQLWSFMLLLDMFSERKQEVVLSHSSFHFVSLMIFDNIT